MSARSVVEHALLSYYADSVQADRVVRVLLHNYDHAHRAQVLTEDGQEYDGELAMYRVLVATLHATVEHGDLPEVKKLLAEHKHDEQEARTAAATPAFFRPGRTYRIPSITGGWFLFRCTSVDTRPDSSERVAVGWVRRDGPRAPWVVGDFGRGVWERGQWTDVTEAGDVR